MGATHSLETFGVPQGTERVKPPRVVDLALRRSELPASFGADDVARAVETKLEGQGFLEQFRKDTGTSRDTRKKSHFIIRCLNTDRSGNQDIPRDGRGIQSSGEGLGSAMVVVVAGTLAILYFVVRILISAV
jgi:hypothetical protein